MALEYCLPIGSVIIGDVMPNSNGEHYQYHVESVLGQGGFGITYKVWCVVKNGQIRTRTNFAIKEHFVKGRCHRANDGVTVEYSREAAADVEESLKDFIKEGRLLQSICQVKNPKDSRNKGYQNIVPVNEVIETNNTAYFVMEYLDGGSLRDMVQKSGTGMSEEKALSLMVPICQAVSYIHSHGILHMDIKPENIVMRRNLITMQEEPVLIDFGVSLHFDKRGSLTTKHTSFGRSEGFSPIEQYGEIQFFQPKIDVYALGATLFYLLVGKVPPSAFNVTADNLEKNIPKTVSERTRKAILHAMTKDSLHRTSSAEDFISELEDRYTLPIGYVLHCNNYKFLIAGINIVHHNYIEYDAALTFGKEINEYDNNVTQRYQYRIFENFTRGYSVRANDDSVVSPNIDADGYENYIHSMSRLTGLREVNTGHVDNSRRLDCAIFEKNGTTYTIVRKGYKPAGIITKIIYTVGVILRRNKKLVAALALIPVCFVAWQYFSSNIQDKIVLKTDKIDKPVSLSLDSVFNKAFHNQVLGDYLYTGIVDKDGTPNGIGEAIFITNGQPNGQTYSGPIKHGVFSGNHVTYKIINKNGGNLFEGTFKDDRYEEGKLTELDSKGNPDAYYVGTFKVNPNNSNPDAEPYNGTWYTKDGKEDGKVVNWINK